MALSRQERRDFEQIVQALCRDRLFAARMGVRSRVGRLTLWRRQHPAGPRRIVHAVLVVCLLAGLTGLVVAAISMPSPPTVRSSRCRGIGQAPTRSLLGVGDDYARSDIYAESHPGSSTGTGSASSC